MPQFRVNLHFIEGISIPKHALNTVNFKYILKTLCLSGGKLHWKLAEPTVRRKVFWAKEGSDFGEKYC